jgi:hypothetical protein
MRRILVAALCALVTVAAGEASNPPGYTQFDLAQQAKLQSDVGVWHCVSVPAATTPLSITENEQGNWFVAREGGDNQATSYERWSHALKAYVIVTISDSGASNVLQTTSLDPHNGTWTPMWPALDNQGRKRFDDHVLRTGNVLHSSTHFYDAQGKVQTSTTTCTKQ